MHSYMYRQRANQLAVNKLAKRHLPIRSFDFVFDSLAEGFGSAVVSRFVSFWLAFVVGVASVASVYFDFDCFAVFVFT